MAPEDPFKNKGEESQPPAAETNKASSWETLDPKEQDKMREDIKEQFAGRGFIFFDAPKKVSPKSIEWRKPDFHDWEAIGIRRRRKWEDGQEVVDEEQGRNHPEFLLWKPVQEDTETWKAEYLIEPRHLIELDTNSQPDNDLTWVRDELEKVPKQQQKGDFTVLWRDMSETLDDKYRRQWVETRSLLQKRKGEWKNKSLAALEKGELAVMASWLEEARTVLEQYKDLGSAVRLKIPYTIIHEEAVRIQVVRDFYWHISELADEAGDGEKRDQYTVRTLEASALADEYDEFIKAKKVY